MYTKRDYIVEVRDQETGFWKRVFTIEPQYREEGRTVIRRFLWFTWAKTTKEIINRGPAELKARKRAIFHGKACYESSRDVRVSRVNHFDNGYKYTTVIWENGKFLDD
jgi:hypothetical protein